MPTPIPFPPSYFLNPAGRWFDEQASANVAPSTNRALVLTVTVPSRQVGILLGVGIDAGQLTNWAFGTWDLIVNSEVDPAFVGVQAMIARLTDPIPLYRIAKGGTSIRLLVSNSNTVQTFQYMGRLCGFFVEETNLRDAEGVDLGGGH